MYQQSVSDSVAGGVVRQDGTVTGGYRCVVCDRQGTTDLTAHLASKEHRNSVIWEAVNQVSPSQFLLSQLPEVVRVAKQRDEVEAVDKRHFSYRCKVCEKKNAFTGLAPLESHLSGKDHEKSLKTRQWLSPVTAQPPVSSPYYHTSPPAPMPPRPRVRESPSQVVPLPPLPRPSLPQSPLPQPGLVPDSFGADLCDEAREAVRKGLVTSNGSSFMCHPCKVSLTGEIPVNQHVRGASHNKKVNRQQLVSDSRAAVVPPNPVPAQPVPRPLPQPLPRPVPQLPLDTDGLTFQWNVEVSTMVQGPSEDVYRTLSHPRGIVTIFNYHLTGDHIRPGAACDSFNLHTLFTQMGYLVLLYEDLTREQTEQALYNLRNNQLLGQVDAFILVILSHGKHPMEFSTNGSDNCKMKVDAVRLKFTDERCPLLRRKPKIFLTNFCRGRVEEQVDPLEYDQYLDVGPQAVAPRDMKTIYASISSFKALRDRNTGTIFVQALCDVLAKHAHNTELSDLYRVLCRTMQQMSGTTPEEQNYNFKKFYFNPCGQLQLPHSYYPYSY